MEEVHQATGPDRQPADREHEEDYRHQVADQGQPGEREGDGAYPGQTPARFPAHGR